MNIVFTQHDLFALSPLLVLVGCLVLLIITQAFSSRISKSCSTVITVIGIVGAFMFAIGKQECTNSLLSPWICFDTLSHFFTIFFLSVGLFTIGIASTFFQKFIADKGEFYFLILTSIFGLILISWANDFLTLFLGLETLSIALYILASYMKKWEMSQEAGIKYFLLGAFSSSLFLFGIACVYGAIGSTQFQAISKVCLSLAGSHKTLFQLGMSLITIGLLFKAAVVPFHMWAPDVYAGSSTPVTAFMSVAIKAGAFSALVRIFLHTASHFDVYWSQTLSFLACITLIYANFVAIRQFQLRSFFAYSGISHAGYLLFPIICQGSHAESALLFYLIVYSIATLASFSILMLIDSHPKGVELDDLQGFFHTRPLFAGILAVSLLTLAGIPPTVGFCAKFYIFKVAYAAGYPELVVIGLLTTILSAYYYLRIIAVMLTEKTNESYRTLISWPTACTSLCLGFGILAFSCCPELIFSFF